MLYLAETSRAVKDEGAFAEKQGMYEFAKATGEVLLDLATSLTPGVSTGRDAYEAFTGKNLLTGEALTTFEQSLAVLCVASLGTGSIVKGALKGVERIAELTKLGNRVETAEHVLKNAIAGAERVIETATHYVPTAEYSKLFTTPEKAVGHFAKHGNEMKTVLGQPTYDFGRYMADANHTINHGTFAVEKILELSDGKNVFEVFSHPCRFKTGDTILMPLVAFEPTDIFRVEPQTPFILKMDVAFGHKILAKVEDAKTPLVRVGDILIELGNRLPGDILKGEYVEFEVMRLDTQS